LIEALDWARDEALKEGDKVFAELGIPKEEALKACNKVFAELNVPEEGRELVVSLLAFVVRRLAAVLKSSESKRCWRRAAFIAGLALAGYPVLPRRGQLPEHVAEALGDALKPCAVDDYLTIDGEIPWLSIHIVELPYYVEALYAGDLSQIRRIRERLCVLTPFADGEIIKAARKTAEGLLARWRRRGFRLAEAIYALGLAALVARGEVDDETADLLLYAASFAVQRVALPVAVLMVLAALRPLGEKAPHRYVVALAAASELERLNQKTVEYIYDALQQLKDRLLEAERRWSLVETVDAYLNMLAKHLKHIEDRWEEAVADMCRLYGEVGKRSAAAAAPESGLSAQRLFSTVAGAYVLVATLEHDDLASLVLKHCGLGDLVGEAEAVRSALGEAAAHPDKLRTIMENNTDFAEWILTNSPTSNAVMLFEYLWGWLTYELARYKLRHALDERGELDEKKLEETAKEFEKAAEIYRRLKLWRNYLAGYGFALRARVLAAKSWKELFERAKGFRELWREAEEHLEPTAIYLAAAASILGDYLVYLAASDDNRGTEKLLKEWWLLDYAPEVSVVARLMLMLFGVGEGARLKEVVDVFEPRFSPEFRPALLMLANRVQRDEARKECGQAEDCVVAVDAAAGNQEAVKRLKSEIERKVSEASLLLDKVDGRTLVEVQAPRDSPAQFAFMLLAAVEGRADAVRLHGLWGSARFKEPLPRRLFRAVYENCGDLDSEECGMALLKLYYLQF
jgi:phosphoglycolate phosphatase-like HAD superfamily hydrolase